MRLVLLEDNQRSGSLLRDHLVRAGYAVDLVSTIQQFNDLMPITSPDLYLIDLGLPDGDGLDVIRRLRHNAKSATPILILSARTSISDRVAGLDCSADDYLCKPFHVNELLARVRALLRRPAQLEAKRIKVGQLVLNCATGDIFYEGCRVDLRPSERQLLALLIRRSGRLVPKRLIEDSLRSIDQDVSPNATEKLVSRLRKSLCKNAININLKTLRGSGYVLEEVAAPRNGQ